MNTPLMNVNEPSAFARNTIWNSTFRLGALPFEINPKRSVTVTNAGGLSAGVEVTSDRPEAALIAGAWNKFP